jgi:type IV pilus assembly protein PilO
MDLGIDFDEKFEKLAKVPKPVRLAVVAAVLVSVAVGYYFMSYQASSAKAANLRAESQELQRKLINVRVVANNLGDFEQEVADLERELQVALKQLPNRKQFEDLLRDISTAGKKVGVEIKSISRTKEQEHDFYVEVPFNIELEGTYHDLAKFFERVSKLPRIVNIGSLKIRTGSKRNSERTMLKIDGTATTFRFLSKKKGPDTVSTGEALRLAGESA